MQETGLLHLLYCVQWIHRVHQGAPETPDGFWNEITF